MKNWDFMDRGNEVAWNHKPSFMDWALGATALIVACLLFVVVIVTFSN